MIRTRSVMVPVPFAPQPDLRAALEILWDPGDDPLPFLRLIAHWQIVGGGEAFLPTIESGKVRVLA